MYTVLMPVLLVEMKVLLSEPALVNKDVSMASLADYTWDGPNSILEQKKTPMLTSFVSA